MTPKKITSFVFVIPNFNIIDLIGGRSNDCSKKFNNLTVFVKSR